jgi:mannose-6-phosphate isomerase
MRRSPVPLELNTPQRFYRGGRGILRFRGLEEPRGFDDRRPEDWLASTTRLFAEGGDGLSLLPDGRTLREELQAAPEVWLGAEPGAHLGAEPGLLVKLLDAAERLPVHVHPDRAFAARHLDCTHGKTEAWLVLEAEPGASVWLGFRDDLTVEQLSGLVDAQDARLLDSLNRLPVQRGDSILVPAGQPHAIGAGVMVVELQEPTDFSVMLEHERFALDPEHSWLGLERDVALGAVDRAPLDAAALEALRGRWDRSAPAAAGAPHRALPSRAEEFFRAEVLPARPETPATADAGFSVVVVVHGTGRLTTDAGEEIAVHAGQTLVTPYSCGGLRLEGAVTAIRCRPGPVPPAQVDPRHTTNRHAEASS